MSPLTLTLALIRIPRLFLSLFMIPLFVSIVFVAIQVLGSSLFLSYHNSSQPDQQRMQLSRNRKDRSDGWVREVLLGVKDIPETIQVCNWFVDPAGNLAPREKGCELKRFDIVLQPKLLEIRPLERYIKMFSRHFTTIHVCDGCTTDIIIWVDNNVVKSDYRSLFALSLFQIINMSDDMRSNYLEALDNRAEIDSAIGEQFLTLRGFQRSTPLDVLTTTFVIITNVCLLIITALWLAMRAHRRILDYFSHSGSLLPLVAASGARTFYCALWILTVLRVFAFLGLSIPITVWAFSDFMTKDLQAFLLHDDPLTIIFWIVALLASLSLATLIASVSELKYNNSLTSLRYKLLPMFACFLGGIIWGLTFMVELPVTEFIRSAITIIPLVGMTPIVMAPIFPPPLPYLMANILFTTALIVWWARRNAGWFAAHLDDI